MKKQILTLAALTTLSISAFGEPYQLQQGFDKIKSNYENSQKNKGEYEKNLTTVNKNLEEVTKAKAAVLKQKDNVSQEILKNNESLKKIIGQEKDIQQTIKSEEDKLAAENKQIEQLQGLIEKIKANQDQRKANIANYQEQLKITTDEKASWKSREAELRGQEAETIKVARGVATEETTWSNRKKGYEIEVNRWATESEKQQKIYDTYQGLKEGK